MDAAIFLISRLLFLNWGDVFFDSGEYISRWAEPNLLNALTSGHPPLHMGYVLWAWPIFRILSGIGSNPLPIIMLVQTVMALLTVVFFGNVFARLADSGVAKRAMILVSILPIFWITNVSVMMETAYLFFFSGSLFFLTKYFGENKRVYLMISCVFWLTAFLTHTVVIIWIPLVLYLFWILGKKHILKLVIAGAATLAIASVINAWFLSLSLGSSFGEGFYWLYAAKFGEHAWFSLSLETAARYLRNWLLPLTYNFTSPVVIFGVISLVALWKRNRKLFWLLFFWVSPSFIANQWWDSLHYGRHALIAGFGLAFLTALVVKGRRFWLLAGFVLIISLSTMRWMNGPAPYQQMAQNISRLPEGGLLIDSHFARPQTQGKYDGTVLYVDEPGWSLEGAVVEIEEYLTHGRGVYITGHALSEPYGLFSGPFLHPLSLSYRKPFNLQELAEKWGFEELTLVERDLNLVIYKILPEKNGYPDINKLSGSKRRIDYLDPSRLFWSAVSGGLNLGP